MNKTNRMTIIESFKLILQWLILAIIKTKFNQHCSREKLFNYLQQHYFSKRHTFLICSDTKDKGKNSVYAFLMILHDIIIKINDLSINEIIYIDRPPPEFKNKYMSRLLYILS